MNEHWICDPLDYDESLNAEEARLEEEAENEEWEREHGRMEDEANGTGVA